MNREFELTERQHARLLEASKPVPAMAISTPNGPEPMFDSLLQKAKRVWQALGDEIGFDWRTARPIPGKTDRFFSADTTPEAEWGRLSRSERLCILFLTKEPQFARRGTFSANTARALLNKGYTRGTYDEHTKRDRWSLTDAGDELQAFAHKIGAE